MVKLKYEIVNGDERFAPEFATDGSACFDLRCDILRTRRFIPEDLDTKKDVLVFAQNSIQIIPLGIKFNIPQGYHVEINVRSGVALNKGIMLVNGTGIIDSDYRDEVCAILTTIGVNFGGMIGIRHQDRLVQGRLVQNVPTSLVKSDRPINRIQSRQGGFGSTGK